MSQQQKVTARYTKLTDRDRRGKIDQNRIADPVRDYLRQIGRIPLLTAAQELEYAQHIQEMIRLRELKGDRDIDIAEWANIAEIDQLELQRRLKMGDRGMEKLQTANLRLVVAIAKKYRRSRLEFLDLIQHGSQGLHRACEKFDPDKGYKFSTYAYWWIKQAITRAISEESRTIRLPVHMTEKLNKMHKTAAILSQKLGRTPAIAEIAKEMDLAIDKVEEIIRFSKTSNPHSLNLCYNDEEDQELLNLVRGGDNPHDFLDAEESRELGVFLMGTLSDREQFIMRSLVGLPGGLFDGIKGATLQEVGGNLNLSRERVRQIRATCIRKMKRRALTSGLLEG